MRDVRVEACALAAASLLALVPVSGDGPSFHPDVRFTGSSLAGWRTLGDAEWRADRGEIVGVPTRPGGGWLVIDRSYQDVAFHASVRCAPGCRTGVLLRAETTPEGMKGVFVSIADGEPASYAITLDAHGREVQRTQLRAGGGQMRIAPPPDPNAAPRVSASAGRGRGAVPAVAPPLVAPDTGFRQEDWNEVEIFIDANIVRLFVNNGRELAGGVAEDDAGRFGPIAIHVAGSADVRFKEIAYKDLSLKDRPAEQVSSRFRMQRLSDFYYSWGAGAADFDHDGRTDVVAGPHIFFGPDYTPRREIYLAASTNPSDGYTEHAWMQYVADFTGDGWADVVNSSFTNNPGIWLYVNPKGEARRWDRFRVVPAFNSEVAVLRDLDADGRPKLVYAAEGTVRFARPDPANPTAPWSIRVVSERGLATPHGIGAGDINGDGRLDIVNPYGWWEQPAASDARENWPYHPQVFSRYGRNLHGGSVMAVYDVNGDRLNDVVTVLNPHGWGLAWFEQTRDASGAISFTRHMVMDDFTTRNAGGVTFSQPHGATYGDVDGDGVPDFIVGKRYWAHRDDYLDPDPYGPAVLYWYRTVRNPKAPGGAELVPELIHNQSGAGSDLLASDLNGDGRLDIVTATRFGTFIFWGRSVRR
jgi:hypothetical protein